MGLNLNLMIYYHYIKKTDLISEFFLPDSGVQPPPHPAYYLSNFHRGIYANIDPINDCFGKSENMKRRQDRVIQ